MIIMSFQNASVAPVLDLSSSKHVCEELLAEELHAQRVSQKGSAPASSCLSESLGSGSKVRESTPDIPSMSNRYNVLPVEMTQNAKAVN